MGRGLEHNSSSHHKIISLNGGTGILRGADAGQILIRRTSSPLDCAQSVTVEIREGGGNGFRVLVISEGNPKIESEL